MKREDAEEYTQALGQVVAGGWRQVALGKRLGVPEALGISIEEWVEGRLGGYVRMSIPERREAVSELADEGMSTREIGEVLGVGKTTVERDLNGGPNGPPESENPPTQTASGDFLGPDGPSDSPPSEHDPQPTAAEPPSVDELADENLALRHSRARKMLAKATAATSELSPSVEQIAQAVLAQHPDQIKAERERLARNRAVWDRITRIVDELAAPRMRRVK